MDENFISEVREYFQTDVHKALRACETFFCSEKYSSSCDVKHYIKSLPKYGRCMTSWSRPTYVVHCVDCSRESSACLCFKCFFDGNHEGHKAVFTKANSGTCDCGYSDLMKSSGFCKKHANPVSFITDITIDPVLAKKFEIVISMALQDIEFYLFYDQRSASTILQWIEQWAKLGDQLCTLIGTIFARSTNLSKLILDCGTYQFDTLVQLMSLVSTLLMDAKFLKYFSETIFDIFPKYSNLLLKQASKRTNDSATAPLKQLLYAQRSFYLAFSHSALNLVLTKDSKVNWAQCFIDTIHCFINVAIRGTHKSQLLMIAGSRLIENMLTLVKHARLVPEQTEAFEKITAAFADAIVSLEGFIKIDCGIPGLFEYGMGNEEFMQLTVYISGLIRTIRKAQVSSLSVFSSFYRVIEDAFINDQFDGESETVTFYRSVLMNGTKTSFSFSLHILAWQNLMPQSKDIVNVFNELSDQFDIYVDDLATYWCVLPLRYIAVLAYASMSLFQFRHQTIQYIFRKNFSMGSIQEQFIPAFLIVQTMLGLSIEPGQLIASIVHTFGLLPPSEALEENAMIEFTVIFYLSCILLDRTTIACDKRTMNALLAQTMMMAGNTKLEQIVTMFPQYTRYKQSFITDFLRFAQRIPNRHDTSFKLYSNIGWHPIVPWAPPNIVFNACERYIEKHPTQLLPFPEFLPEIPQGLDLHSAFSSPVFFAIIYQTISNRVCNDNSSNIVSLHFALNLLIVACSLSQPKHYHIVDEPIASDLEELFTILPDDVYRFVHMKIGFAGRDATSVVIMLEVFGPLGTEVLQRIGLAKNSPDGSVSPSLMSNQKKAAKKAHVRALNHMEKAKQALLSGLCHGLNVPTCEQTLSACMSCGGTSAFSLMALPVFIYTSNLSHHVGLKELPAKVKSMRMCGHVLHYICHQQPMGHDFFCLHDGRHCNFLMPVVQLTELPVDKEVPKLLQEFVRGAFGNKRPLEAAIETLTYEVRVLELRSRSNPWALDDYGARELVRNLFAILWHMSPSSGLGEVCDDPFATVINILISSQDLEIVLQQIASVLCSELDEDKRLSFLRCCTILEMFALREPDQSGKFDWDEVLSPTFLGTKYDVDLKDIKEPPPFRFECVSKSFIANFKRIDEAMLDHPVDLGLCLLTGEIVCLQRPIGPYTSVQRHLQDRMGGGFSVFLALTGKSTLTWIERAHEDRIVKMKSIYLDQFGMDDVGMNRVSVMSLSEERETYLIDILLSGHWIDLE